MGKESNIDHSVKPELIKNADKNSTNFLMPSAKDFKEFMANGNLTVEPRCDLPDFTVEKNGNRHETAKRNDYNDLAYQALNSQTQNDRQPVTKDEQDTAKKVAELTLKTRTDLPKLDSDYDNDIKQLNGIFQELHDPASAQRIIDEANKTLEQGNLRIAQSAVGEIWLGTKEKKDEPYRVSTLIKEVNCGPIS